MKHEPDFTGFVYAVEGSFASSVHGVCPPDAGSRHRRSDLALLVDAFYGHFYVDIEMIDAALSFGHSFNLVHVAILSK